MKKFTKKQKMMAAGIGVGIVAAGIVAKALYPEKKEAVVPTDDDLEEDQFEEEEDLD